MTMIMATAILTATVTPLIMGTPMTDIHTITITITTITMTTRLSLSH